MEHPVLEFNTVINTLELIGVIAFAITGALTAIEREMDIFGITVLALITALGGGIIRDILVNRFPASLQNPIYFFAAMIGVVITLSLIRTTPKYLFWVKLFDALGLAIFSVLGAQVGLVRHLNYLSILLLGLLTGIGGGILRDVLANTVPFVLRLEVYALASVIGITMLWILNQTGTPTPVAIVASAAVIFGIRLAAIHWKLNLPRIRRH
ncbi:MAG TPA: trimeric intracellular cation channel family protein [Armatimonadota bacterium]|nr:trimeric intracellular cation channel family protein [Armatimonadota bacterium]